MKVILITDPNPRRCEGLGARGCQRCKNEGDPVDGHYFCHLHADQRAWMHPEEKAS